MWMTRIAEYLGRNFVKSANLRMRHAMPGGVDNGAVDHTRLATGLRAAYKRNRNNQRKDAINTGEAHDDTISTSTVMTSNGVSGCRASVSDANL